MFNALFGSAVLLHCAKRFDDNGIKVSLAKQRWTQRVEANNIIKQSKCQHKLLHLFRINSRDGSTVRQRCCDNSTIKFIKKKERKKSLPARRWIILNDDKQYKQCAFNYTWMKIDRDNPQEWYSFREKEEEWLQGENYHRLGSAFFWRLRRWKAAFWFYLNMVDTERRESFGLGIWSQKPHKPPTFLCLSVSCSPPYFTLCFCPACLYLLEGFHASCHRENPSCTDVLPGLQFLAFAWSSSHPLQDHRPWWRVVEAPFGSFSFDMGLLSPDTPLSLLFLPLPLSSWVLLWNKESCQEGESIIALAQGATFNVSTQMEKRAQHNKSAVM